MVECYLALDIGGSSIKCALMDRDARILEHKRMPVQTSSEKELLHAIAKARSCFEGQELLGVAVSMPGRIDLASGIAHTGGAFSWMSDYPAAMRFGEVLNAPVTLANDGKCAALAESWKGALSDVDSGAVIVLGTGVGGGIILNREVWMGATGGAGEFSSFPCNFEGLRGGPPFSGELRPSWVWRVSTAAICDAYAARRCLVHANGRMLFDAYEVGDRIAAEVLQDFAFSMGAGIFGIQSVLDLPRYAIGGGISERPEVVELVRKGVDELFSSQKPMSFGKPEVVACVHRNDANLIGALAFHLRRSR